MLQDWKQDARRFEDVDRAALLTIQEADAAESHRDRFGELPANLSARAYREVMARDERRTGGPSDGSNC